MKTVNITGQILYCTMKRVMFLFLTFAVLTGCNGLRMGVGLKGVILDDFKLTLDGDSRNIRSSDLRIIEPITFILQEIVRCLIILIRVQYDKQTIPNSSRWTPSQRSQTLLSSR